jgi:hypothetical protein
MLAYLRLAMINISISNCYLLHAIDYSEYCQFGSHLVIAFLGDVIHSSLSLQFNITAIKHKKLTCAYLLVSYSAISD